MAEEEKLEDVFFAGRRSVEEMLGDLVRMLRSVIVDAKDVNCVMAGLHLVVSLLHGSSGPPPYDWPEDGTIGAMEELTVACRGLALASNHEEEVEAALWMLFCRSGLFSGLASLLLDQVAPDWLACFPTAARDVYFDAFFIKARPVDSLLALVPMLRPESLMQESGDFKAATWQAQRLLVLILVRSLGVKGIAMSFVDITKQEIESAAHTRVESRMNTFDMQLLRKVAQIVASIPDRVEESAPAELRSPLYFTILTSQLLTAAAERWVDISGSLKGSDPVFSFIAETLARLCRRGHADVVAAQMIPLLLQYVQDTGIYSKTEYASQATTSSPVHVSSTPWQLVADSLKDSHAMERWAEVLLREMEATDISNVQAHAILWSLFGDLHQPIYSNILLETFLLSRVFPIRCLKWLLDYGVLGNEQVSERGVNKLAVKRIAETWSPVCFIQSAPLRHQAYVTAALGFCLQAMNREQLNSTENLQKFVFDGITNRLHSPIVEIQDMAARVAFAVSIVATPENPLWLNERDKETKRDLLDWDSLMPDTSRGNTKGSSESLIAALDLSAGAVPVEDDVKEQSASPGEQRERSTKPGRKKQQIEDDPDAVVNYLDNSPYDGLDDAEGSGDSDSESEFQPYDMADDTGDLDRGKFPVHLAECATDLRKGDNPDAVEKALQVLDKLIRAKPDELEIIAQDLTHALVHVRCSEVAVEGEEESAEIRRQNALVSLLVCSPMKTVEVLVRELYSAQVDISQRLLILSVMSDAPRELAGNTQSFSGSVIEEVPGSNQLPWYGPGSSKGPSGSGPWMDVSHRAVTETLLSWGPVYERDIPMRVGDKVPGVTRRWGNRSMQLRKERMRGPPAAPRSRHGFAHLAAAFMLPVMRRYDQKSHGVDFVNRDFIVLAQMLSMLGTSMECISLQPEAPPLGGHLLDLLSSRSVANHAEPFVRRAAIYAASRVLVALHPADIVAALRGGNAALASGLEWIREWAMQIAEDDTDAECNAMAWHCLKLHSEMALEVSRRLESVETLPAPHANLRVSSPLQIAVERPLSPRPF